MSSWDEVVAIALWAQIVFDIAILAIVWLILIRHRHR